MDFEKLSSNLYVKVSHHKFAKKPNDFDKGYVKVGEWINELCWYYISKQKEYDEQTQREFFSLISKQKEKIDALRDSEYKEGLLRAMDEIIKE